MWTTPSSKQGLIDEQGRRILSLFRVIHQVFAHDIAGLLASDTLGDANELPLHECLARQVDAAQVQVVQIGYAHYITPREGYRSRTKIMQVVSAEKIGLCRNGVAHQECCCPT